MIIFLHKRGANFKFFSLFVFPQSEPFLRVSDDESLRGNDRFSGFIPDLLKAISQASHLCNRTQY